MTNHDLLSVAMRQSAEDMGCAAEDFLKEDNVIAPLRLGARARKYLRKPIVCNLISYGNNVVAAVTDDVAALVAEYVGRYPFYHCFETPNMHFLDDRLRDMDARICFMAEYFLPDIDRLTDLPCAYETRILTPPDFAGLYRPEWSNALCSNRKELDALGVGAYDGGTLIGLAACSADCDAMWQIGVDVLPGCRRRGVASALTCALAKEILRRGRVPFYCAAWSNLPSVRNALRSGFAPAWVEMTAKPRQLVEELNAK